MTAESNKRQCNYTFRGIDEGLPCQLEEGHHGEHIRYTALPIPSGINATTLPSDAARELAQKIVCGVLLDLTPISLQSAIHIQSVKAVENKASALIDEAVKELVEAALMVIAIADNTHHWREEHPSTRQGTKYGIYLSADQLESIAAALAKWERR